MDPVHDCRSIAADAAFEARMPWQRALVRSASRSCNAPSPWWISEALPFSATRTSLRPVGITGPRRRLPRPAARTDMFPRRHRNAASWCPRGVLGGIPVGNDGRPGGAVVGMVVVDVVVIALAAVLVGPRFRLLRTMPLSRTSDARDVPRGPGNGSTRLVASRASPRQLPCSPECCGPGTRRWP